MRLRGFFDLFNITNGNAAETRTITTGTSFLRPTAVLTPRTARFGARLMLLNHGPGRSRSPRIAFQTEGPRPPSFGVLVARRNADFSARISNIRSAPPFAHWRQNWYRPSPFASLRSRARRAGVGRFARLTIAGGWPACVRRVVATGSSVPAVGWRVTASRMSGFCPAISSIGLMCSVACSLCRETALVPSPTGGFRMRRWTTGLVTFVSVLMLSVSAFAQGGGASSTGTIQGRVTRRAGRGAARRHGDGDQPGAARAADDGDLGNRQLPLPGGAPGHLHRDLRARRASTRSSAKASRSRSASPPT